MSTRMILTAAAVAVLLIAVAGVSFAGASSENPDALTESAAATDAPIASESAPGTETPTATESASPSTGATAEGGDTYDAGGAGTVTVAEQNGVLTVADTTAAGGWTAHVDDAEGREVEVDFSNGPREVEFDAQLEDGQVRVRVDDEVDDDRDDRFDDDRDDRFDDDRDDRFDDDRDDRHDDDRDDRWDD